MAVARWKFTDVWSGDQYRCVRQWYEAYDSDQETIWPVHGHTIPGAWVPTPPECTQPDELTHTHEVGGELMTHIHPANGTWVETQEGEQITWEFPINPNEGGSPAIEKQMNIQSNVGPYRGGIIQEGRSEVPTISFSGVILTQEHYELFELWYLRRILLDLDDDLGRRFRGVFSQFNPERERRAFNPWYHRYSAQFLVWGYRSALGDVLFGTFET